MSESSHNPFTSFVGVRRLASGSLYENALAVKQALASGASDPIIIFDDTSGRPIDVDLRGTDAELAARLGANPAPAAPTADTGPVEAPRGRGRPKLGVVGREVTLLPRHWAWIDSQPGSASVVLRRLVEQARRTDGSAARKRQAQERAYYFMSAIAGHLAGFEEASRALFADERRAFAERIASWPPDIRDHLVALAFDDVAPDEHSGGRDATP